MIAAVTAAVITAGCVLTAPSGAASLLDRQYKQRLSAVTQALKNDEKTLKAVDKYGRATVFLSVSDGKSKARVSNATAENIDTAISAASEGLVSSGVFPKWVKLDVVTESTEYTYTKFKSSFKDALIGSFRYGVSFGGPDSDKSLLEAQINSCGMLDYTNGTFNWTKVNKELVRMGKDKITKVPKTLYLFRAQGYFAESGFAYKLTNGSYSDTGRREFGTDRNSLELLASKSSSYLASICDNTGKFVYGYYPIDNKEIEGYNTLRHAGTVWNLVMQYEMTGDERLVPVIESGLAWLKDNIAYKDKTTAFVTDTTYLNIGGNGLALLAFCAYAETIGSTKYNSLIRALANGIIYMQKPDGSFTHLLYAKNYKVARDYVVIYYDGEASFGLLKAYQVLGLSKYLNAAKKAADFFIDNKYENENSHWIAYLFNELTKYVTDEKYFEFGLKNITANNYLNKLYKSRAGKNSANETINATFEMYDRLVSGGYKCDYLEQFDAELLIKTLHKRTEYGLNYFMFPEYAMYFTSPTTVLNSFAVREDDFRIRIDDVQHFMDGYYLYWKNYDRIMQYTTEQKETAKTKKAA